MFQLFFSGPGTVLPGIRGVNFDETDAFIIENTQKLDTITYWIKDSALVDNDTLRVNLSYEMTDSLGKLVLFTDTNGVEILAKHL